MGSRRDLVGPCEYISLESSAGLPRGSAAVSPSSAQNRVCNWSKPACNDKESKHSRGNTQPGWTEWSKMQALTNCKQAHLLGTHPWQET